MNSEALINILREHGRLVKELAAAKSLLRFCQEKHVYPKNFEEEIQLAMQSPEIARLSEPFDILAFAVEQSGTGSNGTNSLDTPVA